MDGKDQAWPDDLCAYRRTPDFTERTIPAGLLRGHSTKQGVWAKLHVLEGRLLFRDLVGRTERVLEPGIHPLIHPQALHEVAPQGFVRFFVEFHARGPR
jgi:tellurite resistance-related uncharacterized protein